MARKTTIQHLRTTRAALDAKASASELVQGEIYLITDEDLLAIGLSASTYQTYVKSTDPRLSDQRTPTDDSVTTAKLAASGKAVVAMSGLDVDFDAGLIFTKTLTAAGTITFSNLQIGVRYLLITASGFAVSAPTWINPKGEYNTTDINLIKLIITNATPGSEKGMAYIN